MRHLIANTSPELNCTARHRNLATGFFRTAGGLQAELGNHAAGQGSGGSGGSVDRGIHVVVSAAISSPSVRIGSTPALPPKRKKKEASQPARWQRDAAKRSASPFLADAQHPLRVSRIRRNLPEIGLAQPSDQPAPSVADQVVQVIRGRRQQFPGRARYIARPAVAAMANPNTMTGITRRAPSSGSKKRFFWP